MIGKINHIAIAVPDLTAAAATYRDILGADVSDALALPDHGVTTVFVKCGETKVELLEPLGDNSPIANYLVKHPDGGMHHICYEVDDIAKAAAKLQSEGMRILGDGKPKIGAHGKPVLFLHPKDFQGTLIEIEEV